MRKYYLALFFLCVFTSAKAQINIPAATVVTENFNAIGASATAALPANWKMSSAGSGASSGWATGTNIVSTTQAASSGTPTTGGAYNWATTAGTDRAIGFMTDGAYNSPNSIMAWYRNTTGATVTTLTITFAIERYRANTSPFSLSFFYSADGASWGVSLANGDISGAAFTTAASAYSFTSPQTIFKSVTLTGLNILNNSDFYLCWLLATGNSNSQGIALDNVSVYAGAATPAITAQLRDALTIDNPPINQANPGDQLTYTTVIKNNGTGDANNVNLTAPAPTNTTLVPGSVKTSALARNDTYSTPFNTLLNATTVLTNDYGLPSVTVLSFGPTGNAITTANGVSTASTDNGGSVVMNTAGTFTYTPPAGFAGIDKFAYIAGTGTLPNNDAVVSITVGAAPVGVNDAYNVIGNVSIVPNAGTGVLSNDAGTNNTIVAVNGSAASVGSAIITGNGGNLTVNADGSFTYNPPAGYEGADAFTYTIDNGFSAPSTATVNLTISGMIWFINNTAGAGGDGRISSPLNSLTAFNGLNGAGGNNPAPNDNIFIYTGVGNYTAGINLILGQKLFGQGASVTLAVATGLTVPTGSTPLPATGGTNPVITNAAGNGISLTGTNTVRGLTVGVCSGTAINGNGSLLINDCSINTTGRAINIAGGSVTGTIASVISSGGANNINLGAVTAGLLTISAGSLTGATGASFNISGGSCSVTYSGSITQTNNAAIISVTGGHTTGTIIFQTGTLSATNGAGIDFNNAAGIYNFNGTTTLNAILARVSIVNSSGTFSFGSNTTITNPSGGTAFSVSGGTANITYNGNISQNGNAMVFVGTHTTGTILFQTGTLTATGGTGLQFSDADGTYTFNGAVTLNGGDAGIDITSGSSGNFTFGNAPITNPTGVAFLVNGGNGTISHTGAISKTSAGRLIDIQARTGGSVSINSNLSSTTSSTGINVSGCPGGTITFSGATKTLNTPGSNPVNLATNAGATINFIGGGLAITSTTATGFNATGGGTITVQGTVNTIVSTTGTALNVVSTSIGASNLNFQSIAANGAVNGIVLNNTGTSGGLTVTGTGALNSGGIIQSTTSHGISLTNTRDISLSYIRIQNIANGSGVKGTSVINFSFTQGSIVSTGSGASGSRDCAIAFNDGITFTESNVSGVITLTNSIITNPGTQGLSIENWSGTISNLTVQNNTFSAAATINGGDAIHVFAQGSVSTNAHITTATISGNSITNWFSGSGITLTGGNTSNNTSSTIGAIATPITITGNSYSNSSTPIVGNAIAVAFNGQVGISNFVITNNGTIATPMTRFAGLGISVFFAGNVTSTVLVDNNVLSSFNTAGSAGIAVQADAGIAVTDVPNVTATISNNRVSNNDGNCIRGIVRASNGILRIKILNNIVTAPVLTNRDGIRVDGGSAAGNTTTCLQITGNTSAGSGVNSGIGLRRQTTNVNVFGIVGMAATSTPGVEAYVNGLNPAGGGTVLLSGTTGFSNCTGF